MIDIDASPITYNGDYYIAQANELVRSKQDDLSLVEAKIIRLAISQILKDDRDFRTYRCNVADLAKFLGIDPKNIYRDIRDISMSLMKKSIFIIDKSKLKKSGDYNYKTFNWVDLIEYNDGTLTIRLSESLKPYLIGLNELFTTYGYSAIVALPSNYSIRFYELVASYYNIKNHCNVYEGINIESNEFVLSIEYLRSFFNCENKYPNTNDFLRRTIDSSIEALRKHSFLFVSYRTVTKGRKITHLIFKASTSSLISGRCELP